MPDRTAPANNVVGGAKFVWHPGYSVSLWQALLKCYNRLAGRSLQHSLASFCSQKYSSHVFTMAIAQPLRANPKGQRSALSITTVTQQEVPLGCRLHCYCCCDLPTPLDQSHQTHTIIPSKYHLHIWFTFIHRKKFYTWEATRNATVFIPWASTPGS